MIVYNLQHVPLIRNNRELIQNKALLWKHTINRYVNMVEQFWCQNDLWAMNTEHEQSKHHTANTKTSSNDLAHDIDIHSNVETLKWLGYNMDIRSVFKRYIFTWK